MSIAYIALKTNNSSWAEAIPNIIQFGSVSTHQCYISLLILKHMPMTFDSESFSIGTKSIVIILSIL